MTSFVTFLFVGVVWLSNGSVQPPISRTYHTYADCAEGRAIFLRAARAAREATPAPMRIGFHAERCKAVFYDGASKDS